MPKFQVPAAAELSATRGALDALAHPTRQRILALLLEENKGLPYNEVAERLGFREAASIDQHLKRLVGEVLIGNVLKRIDGKIRSVYFISDWGKDWMGRLRFDHPQMVRMLLEGATA